MIFFSFMVGFAVGAVVVFAAALLAAMTPEEAVNIIKEERLKHGRQVRTDQGSRHSGTD